RRRLAGRLLLRLRESPPGAAVRRRPPTLSGRSSLFQPRSSRGRPRSVPCEFDRGSPPPGDVHAPSILPLQRQEWGSLHLIWNAVWSAPQKVPNRDAQYKRLPLGQAWAVRRVFVAVPSCGRFEIDTCSQYRRRSAAMLWLVLIAALVAWVAWDLVQRRHAILRNFPIVGHFRYWLEAVGPELRQYLVTRHDEKRPFRPASRRGGGPPPAN